MARYNIVIYCPDTNFLYNAETPDTQGIGGGKTSIIRIAQALGALGQKVTFCGNFDREGQHGGVAYRHFSSVKEIDCDVLIATTSGGELDLSPVNRLPVRAKLRAALVHGLARPGGLSVPPFDVIYAPSHFMKEGAVKHWGMRADVITVCGHGIDEPAFAEAEKIAAPRDPFGIVYFGHPAKGLDVAIEVVRSLRQRDRRFHLDIFGGYQLHGQSPQEITGEEGIEFKGMVGQRELARRLFSYGFCLTLQEYEEPFGIAVIEAKRAGVIVLASKVGAHPETIADGYDGFLIDEHYRSVECKDKAVRLAAYLVKNESYAGYIRKNAVNQSVSWENTARAYITHWDKVLNKESISGKKIFIAGSYGAENIGDETVLKCAIDALKEIDPKAEITAISGNPSYTEKKHKCRSVYRGDFVSMARAVEESDFVLLGGGGLFQDYDMIKISNLFEVPSGFSTSFAVAPIMAKIYAKPVLYYALGFGPLFSKEAMHFTRYACSLADLITVRDKPSYDLLQFIGVDEKKIRLTADPALTIKLLSDERINYIFLGEDIPRDKRLISVVVRFWIEKYKEKKIVTAIAEVINKFLNQESGYFFVLIPFSPYDKDINNRILDLIEDKSSICILKREYNVQEIATFISRTDSLIGMRFHSCVFAAIGHVPFIALNYDYKVESFAREMGLDEFIVELSDMDPDSILSKLKLLLGMREMVSEKIGMKINKMVIKEKDNHIFLRDFMEEQTKKEQQTADAFKDDYIAILQKQIASLNKELEFKEKEMKKLLQLADEHMRMISEKDVLPGQLGQEKAEKETLYVQLRQKEVERDALSSQLNSIYSSDFWKAASFYYKVRDRTPFIKYFHRLLRALKRKGFKEASGDSSK